MPVPQTMKVGDVWGSISFTDGFIPSPTYHQRLKVEAKRNPEAVLMRLMNYGAWDMAEEIWDTFIDPIPT